MGSLLSVVAAIGLAGYVSFFNAAYWAWVASSAYFGIRDEQDIGLGLLSTALAVAPLLIGGLVVRHGRRQGMSRPRSWRRGSLAAFVAVIPPVILAAAITVI